ncbi:hypothetical protein P344_00205 [Spiroplasma mirum ATCC 29335]|uniref:Uncharacterized protein n=1 Tax=Spiroplasma mirum ATCC 29335 TaxID=838561 RepID=W6AJC9_9MOLU|nr:MULTISPECIES: hypothetical protein [Spiroplasma]AHI57418.1 hypothetical protein P344_00205 [Spiroplasma mirum ATCC 29335]
MAFLNNSDHPSSSMINPWVDPNVPNPVANPIYQIWGCTSYQFGLIYLKWFLLMPF